MKKGDIVYLLDAHCYGIILNISYAGYSDPKYAEYSIIKFDQDLYPVDYIVVPVSRVEKRDVTIEYDKMFVDRLLDFIL